MPAKNKKSSKKVVVSRSSPRSGGGMTVLPEFKQYPVYNQVFEFQMTSGNSINPTMGTIRKLILAANAAASGFFPIDSFKINLVQIFSIPLTNVFQDISLEWSGTRTKADIKKAQAYPQKPGKISERPPPDSDTSKWQSVNEDANGAFIATVNTDDIVRIHLSYTTGNTATTLSVNGTGATIGVNNFNLLQSTAVPTGIPVVTSMFS